MVSFPLVKLRTEPLCLAASPAAAPRLAEGGRVSRGGYVETVSSGPPWMTIRFELSTISRSQSGATASGTGEGRKKRVSNFDEQSHYVVETKGPRKRTKPNKPKFRRWENPASPGGITVLLFEFSHRVFCHPVARPSPSMLADSARFWEHSLLNLGRSPNLCVRGEEP